jgi:hypothetical protein
MFMIEINFEHLYPRSTNLMSRMSARAIDVQRGKIAAELQI